MPKRTKPVTKLWMGCFSVLEDDDSSQTFQAIAPAASAKEAADVFEKRIRSLRKTATLFDNSCQIFLDVLFELDPAPFATPTIVNYVTKKSGKAFELWCPVPEQPEANAAVWMEQEESDDGVREPFIEFRRAKATKAAGRALH